MSQAQTQLMAIELHAVTRNVILFRFLWHTCPTCRAGLRNPAIQLADCEADCGADFEADSEADSETDSETHFETDRYLGRC